ncbi:AMP-binding protein [Brevundimonas sp.]|uniref:AMP-binding protein n=1 Tax=Brevundimonas sp. TaxID=1871086 RepID=UPI0025D71DD7|nr:AMP-binding protein [Brevundimonas sp.]
MARLLETIRDLGRDDLRLFARIHSGGGWTDVSYAELWERSLAFAGLYRASGLLPDDVVCLVVKPDADAYACFIGAMMAGGLPSFLPYPNSKHDTGLYWTQHRTLFQHARPRLILTWDGLAPEMEACAEGSAARVLRLSEAVGAEPLAAPVPRGEDDLALLQHSSGTTGLKKGVALSYGAIARQVEAYANSLGVRPDRLPVVASWLPLYHDMGLVSSFLLPLSLGGSIVSIDPFVWTSRPTLLWDAVERFRATHAWMPNFAFQHTVRMAPPGRNWDLRSLEALVSCSEPCKAATFGAFLARYADSGVRPQTLRTCYAMAETVFAVSQSTPEAPPRRLTVSRASLEHEGPVELASDGVELLSNGPLLDGMQARIRANGATAGEGMMGEICVRAPFLFDGYYKNPEATAAAFDADGWYRTGDLGFLDQGELFVAGRLKDVIIVNGKNIFSHDVEAALLGIRGLKAGRAVAIGQFDPALGSEKLIVIAEVEGEHDPSAVMAEINRAVLRETGVPCGDVRLVERGWLIKTTSGKISRSENLKRYEARFGAGSQT